MQETLRICLFDNITCGHHQFDWLHASGVSLGVRHESNDAMDIHGMLRREWLVVATFLVDGARRCSGTRLTPS